jgi:hypothetical protein
MFAKYKINTATARLFEEKLYEHALAEVDSGERRNGLWAKAIAECSGNEAQAQGAYLKFRVQSMKDEILIEQTMTAWLKQQAEEDFGELRVRATPVPEVEQLEGTAERERVGFITKVFNIFIMVGVVWVLAAIIHFLSTN